MKELPVFNVVNKILLESFEWIRKGWSQNKTTLFLYYKDYKLAFFQNVYKGSLAAEDAQRLFSVLDQLSEHKEDSQQRNWAVHEDFTEIKSLLEEVVKVIDEIDPSISKTILKEDEYRYLV